MAARAYGLPRGARRIGLPQQAAFRSEIALVRVDVEVMHNGQPVEELTKDDFEITDNGERREIVHFGYREAPRDLILLFDTSLSMQPVVERIAQTGRAALGELRSGDRVAVMAFSNGTDLVLDFTEQFDAIDGAVQGVLQRPFIPNSELQGCGGGFSRDDPPPASALQPGVCDAVGDAGRTTRDSRAPCR